MKKIFLVFLFVLLIIPVVYSCDNEGFLEFDDDGKKISLYLKKGVESSLVKEFNYLPSYQKRLFKFDNGSVVGYLPVKDSSSNIKAWNDLRSDFILFFCKKENDGFIVLDKDIGTKFLILKSDDQTYRWITKTEKEEIKIFKINENGAITNEISFPTMFTAHYSEIEEISEEFSKITISTIEQEASYLIDWSNGVVLPAPE